MTTTLGCATQALLGVLHAANQPLVPHHVEFHPVTGEVEVPCQKTLAVACFNSIACRGEVHPPTAEGVSISAKKTERRKGKDPTMLDYRRMGRDAIRTHLPGLQLQRRAHHHSYNRIEVTEATLRDALSAFVCCTTKNADATHFERVREQLPGNLFATFREEIMRNMLPTA